MDCGLAADLRLALCLLCIFGSVFLRCVYVSRFYPGTHVARTTFFKVRSYVCSVVVLFGSPDLIGTHPEPHFYHHMLYVLSSLCSGCLCAPNSSVNGYIFFSVICLAVLFVFGWLLGVL